MSMSGPIAVRSLQPHHHYHHHQYSDTEDCSGSSDRDIFFHNHNHHPSKSSSKLRPQHLQHLAGMHQHGPIPRRDTDAAVTDSTLFSVTDSAPNNNNNNSNNAVGASGRGSGSGSRKNKKSLRFKLPGLPRILKRSSRKRPLSESQLRKKFKRAAERGDWDAARKLLSRHEFSAASSERAAPPKRGSFNNPEAAPRERQEPPASDRRPSYGSRAGGRAGGGDRRSFTRESAAAAAAINAAMLEESGGSDSGGGRETHRRSGPESRPDVGENILHDACRVGNPPPDVLESLLAALRHRRGCTSGTDDDGRTPLHLAALSGASPELMDALIRADPAPASMGDGDGRSPLHIVVRYLSYPDLSHHYGRCAKHHCHNAPPERIPYPDEALRKSLKTIKILKDAMLSYPGKVGFKDEDSTGYSPLDYAIDGNIQKEELIQALIRRKEPRVRRTSQRAQMMNVRNSFNRTCSRSLYSQASSVTEDQDIEILLQLEQQEIEARVHKIESIKARRRTERRNDALFDVFGIEEQPKPIVVVVATQQCHSPTKALKTPEDEHKPLPKNEEVEPLIPAEQLPLDMTEEDIINRHMEDYLNDYMDDFEGDIDEYAEEDGFNIFDDPEEGIEEEQQQQQQQSLARPRCQTGNCQHVPMIEDLGSLDALPSEISFVDDCDGCSVMSEVTVPLVQ